MKDEFSLNWLCTSSSISCVKMNSGEVNIHYFIYGKNPRLLISSGMHGDEYEVISSVSRSIKKNLGILPSFVFIPIATPSAIKKRARTNVNGQDINRGFNPINAPDESRAISNIVKSYRFDLSVSFHEYPLLTQFYMYDELAIGENKDISSLFIKLKDKIVKYGVDMFNDIDDPNDPNLSYMFHDGYRSIQYKNCIKKDGQFESWMIRHNICTRCFTPDIPKKSTQLVKDSIVEALFTDLIIPFLS